MLSKNYLRNRQRKNKTVPSALKTENDLLRGILENLEYMNELATLRTQYFLLETDQTRPDVWRNKRAQLLRTMKQFMKQSTEGDTE
jgi:hypothetical protein